MVATVTPRQRLIPRRSWGDRYGVRLVVWTAVSALCLVALLILLTLLVDVLVIRGTAAQATLERGIEQEIVPQGFVDDGGLWVQVVRFQDLLLWSWLRPVAEHIPLVTSTSGALSTLVILTLITLGLFSLTRNFGRVNAARSSRKLATWLRSAIHRQTLRLGPSDLTGQQHQEALRHFVDDVEAVRDAVSQWRWRFVRGMIFLPLLAICIVAIDARLGVQCLIPAIACWFVYQYERQRGVEKRQIAEAHAETEVRFLSEFLKQTRLVRGYNMEEFEQSLFQKHLDRMTEEAVTGRRLERAALSTARFVTWAGVALVLLLISLRVISAIDPLPLANAAAMAVALALFAVELNSWQKLIQHQARMEINGDRIYRYLDEIPEVGQAVGARFIQPIAKSIVFENVHYHKRTKEILQGVDLRMEAHTEIALVSLDRLAPRAIAYLIPRFIEPTKGRVLFDGEDIAWGTLESIRNEAVYVGSEDPVLSGTVLENLCCGDTRYCLPDAIEAAKLVHAHKFITNLPQGYDTVLGEHGEQLDIGQAFRLGLARAALRDPAVLIIEEPLILLDEDTKALIDDAYQRLSAKRTIIYLPGRLSTIRRSDQVIMLHDGRVEGIGSHSELSKASELYRHWDYVTFSNFSRRTRQSTQA